MVEHIVGDFDRQATSSALNISTLGGNVRTGSEYLGRTKRVVDIVSYAVDAITRNVRNDFSWYMNVTHPVAPAFAHTY